ncbi:HNH endonuclease [Agromyces badenianii]|uniref:HNH endonuclease n=1 Tax=Agromyces badenianii TaxID=2080742 RepID=UPI000D5906BB|nr:HNH endonuclease [Agromyces badenianii]
MPNRHNGPDPEPSGRERQRLLAEVCPPGSICHLCKEPIEFGLRRWHPRGPSMDHLRPRSKGGTWDRWNLAPAHYGCNSARGNADLEPPKPKRSRRW